MKSISLFLAGIATAAGVFAYAEESPNLIVNGNAADGLNNWKNVQKIADGGPDGAKCFEVTGSTQINSMALIPVDAQSEYKLTGWFKSGSGKENQIYAGLLLFDGNKNVINSTSVNAADQTDAVLASEAKKGDTVVKIKDASKWGRLFKDKRLVIAFDADNSGEYKDLPNYKFRVVTNLVNKDGVWEATLEIPLYENYAADTKVRAHWLSGHYMYAFSMKKNLADWTKYSGAIKPATKFGADGNTFWPGTKYVQVLILANWGQGKDEVLRFSNISLEKVEPKK